jgi:hypothetical protein
MWKLRDRLARRKVDGGLVEKKYKNGSGLHKLETLVVDRDANLSIFVAYNQKSFLVSSSNCGVCAAVGMQDCIKSCQCK